MPEAVKSSLDLRELCPGCGRLLPFTTDGFFYCLRCGRFFCREKCARSCIICGREICFICMEEIQKTFHTSGLICHKCVLPSQARRSAKPSY